LDYKDITGIREKKMKRNRNKNGQRPQSEFYVKMVLPAEQTTAIAKSMLERQAKPNDVSIIGQKKIQTTSEKRQNSKISNKGGLSKTPRQEPPSVGRKRKENAGELGDIVIIGRVLS
jgi:hypothetical protein